MTLGVATNMAIGLMMALLPLYNRASAYNVGRVSRDGLLLIFFVLFAAIAPRKRKLPAWLVMGALSLVALSVYMQWEPASLIVQHQVAMFAGGTAFLLALTRSHDADSSHFILDGMAIGGILQGIQCIGIAHGFDPYGLLMSWSMGLTRVGDNHGWFLGTFDNPNLLGAYAGICSVALLRPGWIFLFPVTGFAVLASHSVMGVATMICGLLFHLRPAWVKAWMAYSCAAAGMVGVFLLGGLGLDSGRVQIWRQLFSHYPASNWLAGNGLGWVSSLGLERGGAIAQEHSEPIALVVAFGAIGLAFVAALGLYAIARDAGIFSAVLFASFANSLGHFTLHQSTTAVLFLTALAVCLSKGIDNGSNLDW